MSKLKKQASYVVPTAEESKALRDYLVIGPPIVSAILGAALIEQELEILLRLKLRPRDEPAWGGMVGERGPLYTFDQKIIMAHGLKLIDDAAKSNMHVVRRIRNLFAHAKKLITLDNPAVIAQLSKIVVPTGRHKGFYASAKEHKKGGQTAFIILCLALGIALTKKVTKYSVVKSNQIIKKSKNSMLAAALLGSGKAPDLGAVEAGLGSFPRSRNSDPKAQGLARGLFALVPSKKHG